jgi:hypothetical protein
MARYLLGQSVAGDSLGFRRRRPEAHKLALKRSDGTIHACLCTPNALDQLGDFRVGLGGDIHTCTVGPNGIRVKRDLQTFAFFYLARSLLVPLLGT